MAASKQRSAPSLPDFEPSVVRGRRMADSADNSSYFNTSQYQLLAWCKRLDMAGTAGRIRRIMLELPDELKQRLESAQINTAGHTGLTSQQAFIREAIARLCTELEVEHNGGAPWPPLPNRS